MKGTVRAARLGQAEMLCVPSGGLSGALLSLVGNPNERGPKSCLVGRALRYKSSVTLAPALPPGRSPGPL